MRVYINNYKDHWISPYRMVDYVFFWTAWSRCNRDRWIVADHAWVETPAWANRLAERLEWLSKSIQWCWDLVDRKIDYVKIDPWDTWSMDHTLAHIVLPMLQQLRATKHGSPFIDDEDVPVHLQSEGYKRARKKFRRAADANLHSVNTGEDSTLHDRWDWVLNEEIWAFEQLVLENSGEDQFWDHSGTSGAPWDRDYVAPKCDWDGLRAHQQRMDNGFRLFGKYFRAHWD